MKKSAILMAVVLAIAPTFAKAQLLESLLFGAISSGINARIAQTQERPISAVKVVFDVYIVKGDQPTYFTSWDPTTQTSVWFGDKVLLKVKAFTNSSPAHDHTIYVNDKLVEWRKVEGGRVVRGRPSGAQGVVGDYPFIAVSDLDLGINQIKVRTSRTEWGSATFIRLDIRQFLQMAADEQARLATAGAGGSMYPVVQSYTAQMPDGTIRNFTSLEEFQIALQGRPANQPPTTQTGNTALPGGFPTGANVGNAGNAGTAGANQPPVEFCAVTVGAMQTSSEQKFDFLRSELNATEQQLLGDARRHTFAPEVTEIQLSSRRNQVVLTLSDSRPFTAVLRLDDKDHPLMLRRSGDRHEAIAWGSIKRFLGATITLIDADGRERTLVFRLSEEN
jgi:hypothetical protein